jgi:putative ABC transport system substrate-binding protein
MAIHIRRREFVFTLGGVAAGWPLAAGAQQPAMPVIGYLSSGSPAAFAPMVTALSRGLNEAGVVEGKDFVIEYHWAEGQYNRLPALAADLVRRKVALIVATGGSDPALAAKAATATIPIVFTGGLDPVGLGLVASLARPGGNATGIINIAIDLNAKRLGVLRELVPATTTMAVLTDASFSASENQLKEIETKYEARATSTTPLNRWFNAARPRCLLMPARFLQASVRDWWHWRRAMPFQRATRFVSSQWTEA